MGLSGVLTARNKSRFSFFCKCAFLELHFDGFLEKQQTAYENDCFLIDELFPFGLPQWHSDTSLLDKKKGEIQKEMSAYIENGKGKIFPHYQV